MDRRSFLRSAGLVGGGSLIAPGLLSACSNADETSVTSTTSTTSTGATSTTTPKASLSTRMLDLPASASPITHVVVVMMENRSFDHWLGWLKSDETWLEQGRSRFGGDFDVAGVQSQKFRSGSDEVATAHLLDYLADGDPWRGCGHPDPGHGWDHGRAQRDSGFLAEGSGNDPFALGYYLGADLAFTSTLAKRFTVCDQSFASVLGPTYPNREYLHSGQSGGNKTNYLPLGEGGFTWPTIWDRLETAGVSHGYYFTDLPVTALWGGRLDSFTHPIDDYFQRCADGTLPEVTFVDPGFLTGSRTDNHPHGDVRSGEAFQRDVFKAFAESPHWEDGLFVLTYDEWGGFFDHVAPPVFADDRSANIDAENFGQAGFRVPTILASPYVASGSVDHTVYDHTSILRFLEWRFLGAPATGTGSVGDDWFLTARDRNANNLASGFVMEPVTDIGMDLDVAIDPPSPWCAEDMPEDASASTDGATGADSTSDGIRSATRGAQYKPHSFEDAYHAGYFERVGYDVGPTAMAEQWRY